eukprot:Rhum_TRINITY_DN21107_c0_g2::Rhum_TRINITY_DN21107_c0_g2_i1::g.173200::m.173200
MTDIDVGNVVEGHYRLLAALEAKDSESAQDIVQRINEDIEEIEVSCEMADLACSALSNDTSALEQRSTEMRGKQQETAQRCAELKEEAARLCITEEGMAKCDILLSDLMAGQSLAELDGELEQELKHRLRQGADACDVSELHALRVHLSQLHDVAVITRERCQYVIDQTSADDAVDKTAKKAGVAPKKTAGSPAPKAKSEPKAKAK